MEWQVVLILIFGSLVVLMMLGLPVVISFMLVNIVGVFLLWGGESGLIQLILSIRGSLCSFSLLPVPLFMLMGEVMFQTGVASHMIDTLGMWLGRLPGRLGLLATGAGTLFATLSGSSMASAALLGSILLPEMEKKGYKAPMSLGPILGSGGLAIMIPPSGLAVLLGAIGEISIGGILIAIIVPGILMAVFYSSYIIGRSLLQPSLAPSYDVPAVSMLVKLKATVQYILPLGLIIFLVTGVIFLGMATPTEAAATGTFGAFILAVLYRRLNWQTLKKSFTGAVSITGMILAIIMGAIAYSQILAFSGATRGLIQLAISLPVHPIIILISIQVVLIIMGMFMNVASIMMITLPMFMPVVHALGFNDLWFGAIYLLNIEMAQTTPPFGVVLFVTKATAPHHTMGEIYRAGLPFLCCDAIVMALMIAFPTLALWLPGMMRPVS